MKYGIYERSLCQSYASAYRAGQLIAVCDGKEEAVSAVEAITCDSYYCFALGEDGTCIDLMGSHLQCLAEVMGV